VRVNRGDLTPIDSNPPRSVGRSQVSGVRARIVAMKPGNSGGAKAWAGKWMHEEEIEGTTTGDSV